MSTDRIAARFHAVLAEFTLNVNLDLPGRGVTAVFGPSGSGKTTLLRCLSGLEKVAGGYLSVAGETWQDDRRFVPTHERSLGYVFQDLNLFSHLTVRGNLEYGRKRVPERDRRVSLDHAVALLDIGHLLNRHPTRLSGGERQRVGIARALATSPRLLLMDEPLAALDFARKQEILPFLERLHDELEIPVIYVSHSADEVARLADHLVVLDGGRALADGALTETLARLDVPIRLGEDAGVVLDGAVVERDTAWHLARVEFSGGHFWVRDGGVPVGHRVRLRVLARDVSIALNRQADSSILNALPAIVEEIGDDSHPALALVRLRIGSSPMIARLTRKSVAALGLRAGTGAWAQIKAVALLG